MPEAPNCVAAKWGSAQASSSIAACAPRSSRVADVTPRLGAGQGAWVGGREPRFHGHGACLSCSPHSPCPRSSRSTGSQTCSGRGAHGHVSDVLCGLQRSVLCPSRSSSSSLSIPRRLLTSCPHGAAVWGCGGIVVMVDRTRALSGREGGAGGAGRPGWSGEPGSWGAVPAPAPGSVPAPVMLSKLKVNLRERRSVARRLGDVIDTESQQGRGAPAVPPPPVVQERTGLGRRGVAQAHSDECGQLSFLWVTQQSLRHSCSKVGTRGAGRCAPDSPPPPPSPPHGRAVPRAARGRSTRIPGRRAGGQAAPDSVRGPSDRRHRSRVN